MLASCGKRAGTEEDDEDHKGRSRLLSKVMKGYSDTVISPLTAAIKENGSSSVKSGRVKLVRIESIQMERERRGKMTEMFSVLESIVPNVFPKATRENIVTETIQYIHRLEEERKRLENLKKSLHVESMAARPTLNQFTTRRNSAINVTICGNRVVFFGIQAAVNRRHLAMEIFGVFEKHGAEVLAATVSVNDDVGQQQRQLDLTVTAFVGGNGDSIENIKREIMSL